VDRLVLQRNTSSAPLNRSAIWAFPLENPALPTLESACSADAGTWHRGIRLADRDSEGHDPRATVEVTERTPVAPAVRRLLDASALARRAITADDLRELPLQRDRLAPAIAEVLLLLFLEGPRSAAALHTESGINYATVRHAFGELAKEHLIERSDRTRTGEVIVGLTPSGEEVAEILARRVHSNLEGPLAVP
jgi:DNA-binding MarR family transcriptional regulator